MTDMSSDCQQSQLFRSSPDKQLGGPSAPLFRYMPTLSFFCFILRDSSLVGGVVKIQPCSLMSF